VIGNEWKEGGGRILLGNNTDDRMLILRSIWFRCDGFRISARFPCVCVRTWPCNMLNFDRHKIRHAPERKCRICREICAIIHVQFVYELPTGAVIVLDSRILNSWCGKRSRGLIQLLLWLFSGKIEENYDNLKQSVSSRDSNRACL
jgi:hypothetical protein